MRVCASGMFSREVLALMKQQFEQNVSFGNENPLKDRASLIPYKDTTLPLTEHQPEHEGFIVDMSVTSIRQIFETFCNVNGYSKDYLWSIAGDFFGYCSVNWQDKFNPLRDKSIPVEFINVHQIIPAFEVCHQPTAARLYQAMAAGRRLSFKNQFIRFYPNLLAKFILCPHRSVSHTLIVDFTLILRYVGDEDFQDAVLAHVPMGVTYHDLFGVFQSLLEDAKFDPVFALLH